jgi:hypothetical protein
MKIITIFLPSCFFFMSRAVTLYMATLTTMLAQDIIFTVNPTTDNNNSVNVLLGASNCKRLGKVSPNCINASISGATLENIDETIKLAKSKVFIK